MTVDRAIELIERAASTEGADAVRRWARFLQDRALERRATLHDRLHAIGVTDEELGAIGDAFFSEGMLEDGILFIRDRWNQVAPPPNDIFECMRRPAIARHQRSSNVPTHSRTPPPIKDDEQLRQTEGREVTRRDELSWEEDLKRRMRFGKKRAAEEDCKRSGKALRLYVSSTKARTDDLLITATQEAPQDDTIVRLFAASESVIGSVKKVVGGTC